MIPILTLSEMREAERRSIEEGVTEYDLIVTAGEAVFQSIKTLLDETEEDAYELGVRPPPPPPMDDPIPGERDDGIRPPAVALVCGKGHNGADALAAALLCAQNGLGVVVYQIHSEKYSPETRRLRQQLAAAEIPVHSIRSAVDLPVFEEADLIVDGLLGTGLKGAPEGLIASLIHGINRSGRPVLSIDIPSGVECDSAEPPGSAVRADSTICLGALKPSAVFFPSSLSYGKTGYSPIGFPDKMLADYPSRMAMYTEDDALDHLPLKTWRSNKYSAGKVLVVAGSLGMHGAAALCANAALRSGAGMVRAAVPGGIYSHLSAHLLEIIGVPAGSEKDSHFAPAHVADLKPWVEWADTIVIGPGLGKHPDTRAFLDDMLPLLRGRRVVVDGDALACLDGTSGSEGLERFVATPHAGEYRRMGGAPDPDETPLQQLETLRNFAATRGFSVVLKGATTAFAEPAGGLILSASGTPGMATAGSGDVLAGVLGALLTQRPASEAAPLAVFLHGRAGESARRDRGTLGMTASDLILYLPLALKELEDVLYETDEPEDDEV